MIDYAEFCERAAANPGRCVILARHGERPPIDPDDPTFGRDLPLTDAGEALARSCGRALRSLSQNPGDWLFGASPYARTRLTAQCVAEEVLGREAGAGCVRDCAEIGIPGIWIEDAKRVYEAMRRLGVAQYHERQMRTLEAPGFRNAKDVVAKFLAWISGPAIPARYAFLASHDCHIAYLMNGLGVANFTIDDWVGFLQGCALFEQTDGTWTAEHIVPDKANHHSRFVY